MSEPDLEAIRARKDAATPEPWEWDGVIGSGSEFLVNRQMYEAWTAARSTATDTGVVVGQSQDCLWVNDADAEFIVHSRTDIPDLLEAIDRLRSMLIDAETEAQMQAAEVERLRSSDDIVRKLAAGDYVYDTVSCWFCGSGVKWREGGLSSGATTDAEMYVGQHSDGCLYALALAYVEANPA